MGIERKQALGSKEYCAIIFRGGDQRKEAVLYMIMTRSMKEFTLPQNSQLPRTASLKKHRSMITAAQSPCNVDAGGCVSTLFHMFDWNPSGKKMSSSATKRLPSRKL